MKLHGCKLCKVKGIAQLLKGLQDIMRLVKERKANHS